jgi:hypothetical protein
VYAAKAQSLVADRFTRRLAGEAHVAQSVDIRLREGRAAIRDIEIPKLTRRPVEEDLDFTIGSIVRVYVIRILDQLY